MTPFFYLFSSSQLPQHPPLHPLQPEHEHLPFLRFLTDTTTTAINITAISAATIKVGQSMLNAPFVYFVLTYLFFLKRRQINPARTTTAAAVHTVNTPVVINIPN